MKIGCTLLETHKSKNALDLLSFFLQSCQRQNMKQTPSSTPRQRFLFFKAKIKFWKILFMGFSGWTGQNNFFRRPVVFMRWHFLFYSQMLVYKVSWKHNKSIPGKLPTIDGKKTRCVNTPQKYLFMWTQVQYTWSHCIYALTYRACGCAFYTDKHAHTFISVTWFWKFVLSIINWPPSAWRQIQAQ